MFRALALVLLFACSKSPGAHSTPVYTPLDETADRQTPMSLQRGPMAHPFLYVVHGTSPSFILGTQHGVSLADGAPGAEHDVLASPRLLLVDVLPTGITAQDLRRAMLSSITLDLVVGSLPWRDLTDELVPTVERETLLHMRPWYALGALVSHRTDVLFDGTPPESMSVTLAGHAQEHELSIAALENGRERVGAMNAIPEELMIALLRRLVEEPEQHDNHLRALVHHYRAGDESSLVNQLQAGLRVEESDEIYRRFYLAPNARWLTRIRQELDEGNVVIAIDIGHLLGPQGLLETLRGLRYNVERVDS